ncbi:radical SAM/SPASM domain-containing protein [Spirillospora sp. NPDC052269]
MTELFEPTTAQLDRLWLDLTRRCQLACVHCLNDSSRDGDHGDMTREDWFEAIDQATEMGVRTVQLFGGEPTLHPHAAELARRVLKRGLELEIYTNMVAVHGPWWELFGHPNVTVLTSYYSADPVQHELITGKRTHRLTHTNIRKAVELGVRLKVGIVEVNVDQDAPAAQRELEELGVTAINVDRTREFGRGRAESTPDMANLCGTCGNGRHASVSPTGQVSACVFSTEWSVGNVHHHSLARILGGESFQRLTAEIRNASERNGPCDPDVECNPGTPGSECSPKA